MKFIFGVLAFCCIWACYSIGLTSQDIPTMIILAMMGNILYTTFLFTGYDEEEDG